LRAGKVAQPEQAHLARAPGLLCSPFDQIVEGVSRLITNRVGHAGTLPEARLISTDDDVVVRSPVSRQRCLPRVVYALVGVGYISVGVVGEGRVVPVLAIYSEKRNAICQQRKLSKRWMHWNCGKAEAYMVQGCR
jgi:hypothetical protein